MKIHNRIKNKTKIINKILQEKESQPNNLKSMMKMFVHSIRINKRK